MVSAQNNLKPGENPCTCSPLVPSSAMVHRGHSDLIDCTEKLIHSERSSDRRTNSATNSAINSSTLGFELYAGRLGGCRLCSSVVGMIDYQGVLKVTD